MMMSKPIGPIYRREDYAGFVRRTLALIIDAVILMFSNIALKTAWYKAAPAAWVTARSYSTIDGLWFLGAVCYLIGFRLTIRGTPGYRLMGIRYAYMLAERPRWIDAAFRAVAAFFLLWAFALDHIWILFDERKQAWHDKLTGFYVINKRAEPVAMHHMSRRVINFALLSFVVWEPAEPAESRDTAGATGIASGLA